MPYRPGPRTAGGRPPKRKTNATHWTSRWPVTDRQLGILKYILYFLDRWGVQPTVDQIAVRLNVTQQTVCKALEALRLKGYIGLREPGFLGVKIYRRPDGTPYYRGEPGP